MELNRLVISGFRSFGPEPTTVDFDARTFLLGPNGAGKTAVLQALSRLFAYSRELRRVRESDFHQPAYRDEGEAEPDDRELMLEAHFRHDELTDDEGLYPSVPPNFRHMSLIDPDGTPEIRVRLTATIDSEGDIEEQLSYITDIDDDGSPTAFSQMSRYDRSLFHVHYLPARRDPADHIRTTANSLVGRLLRSASWSAELGDIEDLSSELTSVLTENAAVGGLSDQLTEQWSAVHSGSFFADPMMSFDVADLEGLLRHLTIEFSPAPADVRADYGHLSDGQQSLLFISLVLAVENLGRKAIAGEIPEIDLNKLRPPVFVMIVVEEPENSLSPHYLGRVLAQLTTFSSRDDAQVVLATHSPALLRRVPPEEVRHLRLDKKRCTCVTRIKLPEDDADAAKFVREAVQAYPELYFSRLVVLGEGDSEEIVLPRLLASHTLVTDHVSVSVAPLGGRHVNHFWQLLDGLEIPYVTLLDLDAGRYGGGWGRIRYALKEYRKLHGETADWASERLDKIPKWNSDRRPDNDALGELVLGELEDVGVFFSSPLDLDMAMLSAYPSAYGVDDENLREPDANTVVAVLGKLHSDASSLYDADERSLFDAYRSRFRRGSKPARHLNALGGLSDRGLSSGLPALYSRLVDYVSGTLETLPE